MTHTELNQAIRECILNLYGKVFIGDIKIEDLDPVGYKVSFYLTRSENPIVIMSDLPDKQFLSFIREELRRMKLHVIRNTKDFKIPNERKRTC